MKIIAIEKELPGKTAADFKPHLVAEAQQAWSLYQSGIIREIYFRADQSCAVIILECPDVAVAKEKLATLPLVQNRLIEFELIPLVPYPGWERLFQTGGTNADCIYKNGKGPHP